MAERKVNRIRYVQTLWQDAAGYRLKDFLRSRYVPINQVYKAVDGVMVNQVYLTLEYLRRSESGKALQCV